MLYSKTVSEIDLGTHSIITTDGSRLYATGNRFFLPGDIVYTDGTYAYGLQKRRGGGGLWGGSYCLYYDPSYGGLVTIDVRTFRIKLLCNTPYMYFVGAENGAYAYTENFEKLFNLVTGKEISQDLRGDNQNENYIRDHYAVDDACISDAGDLLEISAVAPRKYNEHYPDGIGIFKNGKFIKYQPIGSSVTNLRIYKDGTYTYNLNDFEFPVSTELNGSPIIMNIGKDGYTIKKLGLAFSADITNYPVIAAAAQNTYIVSGYGSTQKEIKGIKVHLLKPQICDVNFRFAKCSGPMLAKIKATATALWGTEKKS